MTLEQALDEFKASMLWKFQQRASKHGERSVTVAGDTYLQGRDVYAGLCHHLADEYAEFCASEQESEAEMDEAVDVANMAFLVWWHDFVLGGVSR